MGNVVIYGNGPVAKTVYYCLTCDSSYRVKAFTVDREVITEPQLLGLPVTAFDEVERHFTPDRHRMLIAVGFARTNQLRAQRHAQAKEKGYALVTYVSSRAIIGPDVVVGDNCIIGANVVIQPSVRIGDDVVIRDNSFIGHDTTIGDHCYLAVGAVVLGGTVIEPYCLVGANATIREGVRVSRACVVGAGVALLHNASEKQVYVNKGAQQLPLTSDQL